MDEQVAKVKILNEYHTAVRRFPKFNSTHEGYAVLLEEFEELWGLIKKNGSKSAMADEAKQVGAMALRFLTDCC
jgi:hypothetical protein